jgi:hypothetical protein
MGAFRGHKMGVKQDAKNTPHFPILFSTSVGRRDERFNLGMIYPRESRGFRFLIDLQLENLIVGYGFQDGREDYCHA